MASICTKVTFLLATDPIRTIFLLNAALLGTWTSLLFCRISMYSKILLTQGSMQSVVCFQNIWTSKSKLNCRIMLSSLLAAEYLSTLKRSIVNCSISCQMILQVLQKKTLCITWILHVQTSTKLPKPSCVSLILDSSSLHIVLLRLGPSLQKRNCMFFQGRNVSTCYQIISVAVISSQEAN